MSYDPKTHTFTIGPGHNINVDLGVSFIFELQQDSRRVKYPHQIRQDWAIIEQWLGCQGRELNSADIETISSAWRAYLGIGVAPSITLQPMFDQFSEEIRNTGVPLTQPPVEVKDVFDRLMASDEEIAEKRARDMHQYAVSPRTDLTRCPARENRNEEQGTVQRSQGIMARLLGRFFTKHL